MDLSEKVAIYYKENPALRELAFRRCKVSRFQPEYHSAKVEGGIEVESLYLL